MKQPSVVELDHFDKTFSLGGGKIIGAFCGLVEFSGRAVDKHIEEIVGPELHARTRFSSVVDLIALQIEDRLNHIDEHEVMPAERKLDLLLVGGERLMRSEMKIFSIRFHQQKPLIQAHKQYCRAGEDAAAGAAGQVLKAGYVGNRGAASLESLARKAITAGISSSGLYTYGSGHRACGGDVFVQRTSYP